MKYPEEGLIILPYKIAFCVRLYAKNEFNASPEVIVDLFLQIPVIFAVFFKEERTDNLSASEVSSF